MLATAEVKDFEMDSYRQSHKQNNRASRYHARLAGLFTMKRFALLLLVAAAILARPAWRGWQSYKLIRTTETQLKQMIGLEWSIMYRDELLTMSLKMAAATGDMKWVSHYEELGQRIKSKVKESWGVSENHSIVAEAIQTVFANDKLTSIEDKALELMRQGKRSHVTALLQSQEYGDQKHAYNSGMKAFVANVHRTLEDRCDEHRRKVQKALTAISIILPVIVLFGLVVLGVEKHIYERKGTKQKISAFKPCKIYARVLLKSNCNFRR